MITSNTHIMSFPFTSMPTQFEQFTSSNDVESQSFDLNIDNYSIDDLFSIYKIRKQEQANVTEEYIKKSTEQYVAKVDELKTEINKLKTENNNLGIDNLKIKRKYEESETAFSNLLKKTKK